MLIANTLPAFDDSRFREVLSHYPTGVAVVTAKVGDRHLGMVVGSFTSVSLKPPLVAFLADHYSRTYGELKDTRHFVVNILAADQEHVCRRFASKSTDDKWQGVGWKTSGNGVRKLLGAVAHIECTHAGTHEAGDHDIVLGRVDHLTADNPVLPLLFFQGGYGKFAPQSLVIPSQIDVAAPLRIADVARPHMEGLAREFGAACSAQAKVNNELVYLASFQGDDVGRAPPRLGRRVPHLPPLGTLFVAWEPESVAEQWLGIVGGDLGPERECLRAGLERVRSRGYSLALESEEYAPLERVAQRFSNGQATPSEERYLREMTVHLAKYYEPAEIPSNVGPRVRVIGAPIFASEHSVGLVLQIWRPAVGDTRNVADIAEALRDVARHVEKEIRAA